MPKTIIFAALVCLAVTPLQISAAKKSAYVSKQEQADQLYDQGKYNEAFSTCDMITTTRYELRECTGSRLGTRCEEVYAAQMPKFRGINPGNGSDNVGGSASRSGSRSSASIFRNSTSAAA